MKPTAALLCLLLAACTAQGLRQGSAGLEAFNRTLADMESFSAAHPETAGDVESIARIRKLGEQLNERIQAALEDGRETVDVTDLLDALDEATERMLVSDDPRVGRLAIGLRGTLNLLRVSLSGQPTPQ
jgi:hypothetical protein